VNGPSWQSAASAAGQYGQGISVSKICPCVCMPVSSRRQFKPSFMHILAPAQRLWAPITRRLFHPAARTKEGACARAPKDTKLRPTKEAKQNFASRRVSIWQLLQDTARRLFYPATQTEKGACANTPQGNKRIQNSQKKNKEMPYEQRPTMQSVRHIQRACEHIGDSRGLLNACMGIRMKVWTRTRLTCTEH
jgi:hypothetical protein